MSDEVVIRLSREDARLLLEDEDLELYEHWADPDDLVCWRCRLADELRAGLEADEE